MKADTSLTEKQALKIAEVSSCVVRYCWGNEQRKTWYITKTTREIVPKGSRLLLKISGELTTKKLSSAVLPQKGDVVCDVDGNHLRVLAVEWV